MSKCPPVSSRASAPLQNRSNRHLSVRIAVKSAAPEITTVKVTEEELATEIRLTKLPPTITVTDGKTTIKIDLTKLRPPALAPLSILSRPGLFSPEWETLLVLHFALTKATMPTLHFWLYTAETTFPVAIAAAISREKRAGGILTTLRAAGNAIWARPSLAEDNFWYILLSRLYATAEIQFLASIICPLALLPVMAYDLWWPGGAEQDAFVHGYFKGIYGMGRPY